MTHEVGGPEYQAEQQNRTVLGLTPYYIAEHDGDSYAGPVRLRWAATDIIAMCMAVEIAAREGRSVGVWESDHGPRRKVGHISIGETNV